jgi:hypothetical protein
LRTTIISVGTGAGDAEGEGGLSKDEWNTFFNLKQFAANFRALFFTFGQPEFGQSHFALLDQEP